MPRFKLKKCLVTSAVCLVTVFLVRSFTLFHEITNDSRSFAQEDHRIQKRKGAKVTSVGGDGNGIHNLQGNSDFIPFLTKTVGNFEPPSRKPVPGPGEGGKPVRANREEQADVQRSIDEYGFNQYVSDKISLDRNIPDLRHDQCKYWNYPKNLPSTSVIIVFHNEGWSTLLRTVHSVFNRSPPHLLKEIIMVDDFSTKDHLQKPLEDHINDPKFLGKVKLHRNSKREGLIRTRIIGARHATGEVLLWLDAHCEAGLNWLPPLLTPIAANRTTAVCPLVDVIDNQDYSLRPQGTGSFTRGGFDWSLFWKHFPLPEFEKKRRKEHTEPYRSPAMAGGLFAMDREFFFELGAYDEGLEIWGGENFELSFKIWMCGGSLLWVPCSRVGHVYRIIGKVPYRGPNGTSTMGLSDHNLKRVVEVWMDEYKEYFYRSKPEGTLISAGNLKKQHEFRQSHQCKSFDWFMKEVAPDITLKFPFPVENKRWGEVRSLSTRLQCMDTMGKRDGGPLGVSYCHGAGGNQLFKLAVNGDLRVNEQCAYEKSSKVFLRMCGGSTQQHWDYNTETSAVYLRDVNRCIELENSVLLMVSCDPTKANQKWDFTYKHLMVAQLNQNG